MNLGGVGFGGQHFVTLDRTQPVFGGSGGLVVGSSVSCFDFLALDRVRFLGGLLAGVGLGRNVRRYGLGIISALDGGLVNLGGVGFGGQHFVTLDRAQPVLGGSGGFVGSDVVSCGFG